MAMVQAWDGWQRLPAQQPPELPRPFAWERVGQSPSNSPANGHGNNNTNNSNSNGGDDWEKPYLRSSSSASKVLSTGQLEDEAEPVESDPRDDLDGLLEHFESLKAEGCMLTEVTYVVNYWGGGNWVLPLRHHGFVIRCSHPEDEEKSSYLSLDFGRRGILWDTYEDFPELPDHTAFVRKYKINIDPLSMKIYCQETKPFSWFAHDCERWALNAMKVMKISEEEGYHPGSEEGRMPGAFGKKQRLPRCAPVFAMCASA